MRTVSFSDPTVRNTLANEFVSAYTNTQGTANTGMSFSHSPNEPPGPCGRGAGRQNVQTIFMTPRGQIYHVATGFLSPQDLREELDFAGQTHQSLQQAGANPQTLVALQSKRMNQLGFSQPEVFNENQFQDLATMFSPSDLGIEMPGSRLFGDVGRNRVLRDAKFVMKYPLMDHQQFEQNPALLVGHHKSFFGSNASFNGLNKQINQVNDRAISRSTPGDSTVRSMQFPITNGL